MTSYLIAIYQKDDYLQKSAITEFSLEEILTAQEWLNNYPRQVLNGLSANQLVTAFA